MRNNKKTNIAFLTIASFVFLCGCNNYFKNDYEDNSPTSGKLKIYYDEGLHLHVKNQVATFESHYPGADLEAISVSESEAVQALYSDSCEAIMISRGLNEQETKAFASKGYSIRPTPAAKSGIAVITNKNTHLKQLSFEQIYDLLTKPFVCIDSVSNETKLFVIFDKNNSSVIHYLLDSVLNGQPFSPNCTILNSTQESINYVAQNKNTVAFIDFAWLSDVDDSISKANTDKIKFIPISKENSREFELPSQSSFKLNTYPFTRTIYVIKKTGDFSLAKGFETFVAGPKGQTIFLKQGLLPAIQQERAIEVKMEPSKTN
ncbi:PstS family phosphate ABC transporter substrate-binding protein [Sediminibacterium sp.]|uniref:PstS family phosphate ABC transporter substrate-binding protein n=1 Tax=Sediminibacterium sp. TaxID=1917865 RepID=UPI0027189043|nr:substrate-binding domain-containing protein [Sediminibacterium sp.]MDO9000478.1 substrate-binding domain-containing protein [Bacteroidota bacterium]MDP3146954.1 substrate-binding domain-containing protein [Bacteroidota bacterium]MDP3567508.1 substrate-binding domain-containing protein [Sediminibacterium sp.]